MIKTNVDLSKRQKKQLLRSFILSIILIIGLFLPPYNEFVNRFEQTLYDFRLRSLNNKKISKDIVIVDIDTASINKLSLWPWPRSYWASAITHLNQYKPRVIGIDVLFDTNNPNKDHDILLANVLKQYKNIVLASRHHSEKKAAYEIEVWSKPIDIFSQSTPDGFINVPVDSDGIVRKSFFSLSNHANELKYSFNHVIFNMYKNKSSNHSLSIPQKSMLQTESTNTQFFVNYMVYNNFKRIPFHVVLENRIPNPDWIKDKIILIGASDPALNDLFFTPLGLIPAVDIHAHSLSTFLSNRFITPFNHLLNSIFICVLLLIAVTIVILFSGYTSFLSMLFILISYLSISYVLFVKYLILMTWAPFILAMILGYSSTLIIKLISEEQQRKYIRSVFSQYVSPEVVKTLINSPEALTLGGQRKTVSIFFSDIRSFTSLSEKYPPEQIISQLNEYLDVMTRSIFKWKGTLDKYIGDEIMAIWGAPIDDEQHALHAVLCAWEHLTLLKTLQQKWKKENLPLLDIGIGINSGEVVVGNIGSTIQKDYTVIGDEVNYAARLETLTRKFSNENHICRLIISESTYKKVQAYCKVKSLGTIPVKGKEKSYPIYEVLEIINPYNKDGIITQDRHLQ